MAVLVCRCIYIYTLGSGKSSDYPSATWKLFVGSMSALQVPRGSGCDACDRKKRTFAIWKCTQTTKKRANSFKELVVLAAVRNLTCFSRFTHSTLQFLLDLYDGWSKLLFTWFGHLTFAGTTAHKSLQVPQGLVTLIQCYSCMKLTHETLKWFQVCWYTMVSPYCPYQVSY